ncbi:MAG: alpha/beta hydrolase [Pontixanthobacter sp.]
MNAGEARNRPQAGETFDRRAIPAAARESVWIASDGHAIRRIDWAPVSNARGAILFLPGRGDAYEKYLETLHEWHRAGWYVTGADWRGQAGSGRLGADGITGHVDDFGDWVDDLAQFWAQWITETPGPHIVAGHSMGGHLVLRALAERRIAPAAAILSAPMLEFTGAKLPHRIMHGAARMMKRLRGATTPAWKWSEKPGEMPLDRINLLTHDADRYADELFWRDHRPQLVMGPGSWGWVERAYVSMGAVFAPGLLEQVDTPVLLIATSNDRLVDMAAIERAANRLPNGALLAFGDEARHELLREVDAVRDRAMAAIARFLDDVAPK